MTIPYYIETIGGQALPHIIFLLKFLGHPNMLQQKQLMSNRSHVMNCAIDIPKCAICFDPMNTCKISLTTNSDQTMIFFQGFGNFGQNKQSPLFSQILGFQKKGFLISPLLKWKFSGNLMGPTTPKCHGSIQGNNRHSQQMIHHRCPLMKGLSYWVLYLKGRGWHWLRLDILDSPEQFCWAPWDLKQQKQHRPTSVARRVVFDVLPENNAVGWYNWTKLQGICTHQNWQMSPKKKSFHKERIVSQPLLFGGHVCFRGSIDVLYIWIYTSTYLEGFLSNRCHILT